MGKKKFNLTNLNQMVKEQVKTETIDINGMELEIDVLWTTERIAKAMTDILKDIAEAKEEGIDIEAIQVYNLFGLMVEFSSLEPPKNLKGKIQFLTSLLKLEIKGGGDAFNYILSHYPQSELDKAKDIAINVRQNLPHIMENMKQEQEFADIMKK